MSITRFGPLDCNHCMLHEGKIDLWQFSLKTPLENAFDLLDDTEKARASRFYFAKHQRRFATARAFVRIILGRYLNLAPESLEFNYNPQGKPSVVNNQKLQFNLSHTGDLALLAVGKAHPIGVDIEQYSARPYEGIAQTLFSQTECEGLQKAPQALKPAVFFHIWSQKEAFIKVLGLGLSYPTKEFSVPIAAPTKQLIEDSVQKTTWMMHSFMPQIACSGALCHHPTIKDIRYGVVQVGLNPQLVF
jgi:4'-phosphopantetheinyl transferase